MVDTGEGQCSSAWERRHSLERLKEGRQHIRWDPHACILDLEQYVHCILRLALLSNSERNGACGSERFQKVSKRTTTEEEPPRITHPFS